MSEPIEKSTTTIIAELREQLAARDVQIVEKQTELESTTSTFLTVLALKNRKIKDLEEQISRLNVEKCDEVVHAPANCAEPTEQVTEAPTNTVPEENEQTSVQNVEETAVEHNEISKQTIPNAENSPDVQNGSDLFAGEWLNVSSENVEAYLKEVGYGMLARNIAARMRPVLTFEINGGDWTMNLISSFKTQETKFRLGEELEEESPSGGRISSTYELTGPTLMQTSRGANGEPDFRIERTVEGNTLTIIAECNGVQCTRVYEKVA